MSTLPIARKVISRLKSPGRKSLSMKRAVADRAAAQKMYQELTAEENAPPAFAAYMYAIVQTSLLAQQLLELKEMAPFEKMIAEAEQEYMPSGPPMSPLTSSYFNCWSLFDACSGPSDETVGTTILELSAAMGQDTEVLSLIRNLQQSRMGLYLHKGQKDGLSVLEDIASGAVCHAIVPSGDAGTKGKLWYARVLPPPTPAGSASVVMTTPYVILKPALPAWREYFQRAVPAGSPDDAIHRHLKFGPTRQYWNEYILEAYVNHTESLIYLTGLPDVHESRPHSRKE